MSDNSGEQLIDEPDVALFDDLLSSTRSTEDRQAAVGACLAFADAKKDEMRKYNASQLVLTYVGQTPLNEHLRLTRTQWRRPCQRFLRGQATLHT